jgi:osmotically inducible protein OsmC
MITRSANATWKGNLKEGKGSVSTESGVLNNIDYSFSKRFENEKGTNPEELIGAAHAACFSMALSNALASAGHKVNSVKTTEKVILDKVADGFSITRIEMLCEADVEGIDEKEFLKFAEDTKKGCPISKALASVEMKLDAKLKTAKVA